MKVCISLLLAACVFAQTQRPVPDAGVPNLPIQQIGPNDLIAVSVYDSPELTRTIRVGADGIIRLPMLKASIDAAGRMPAEIERVIADALVAEHLIVDPLVAVNVAEYSSRPISVAGAVKMPLTFQAAGRVTLLEAVTRAGGLSPEAGGEILVTRRPDPAHPATALVQRIATKQLIDAADPDANIALTGGEEIRVPEVGKIFVIGNVRKPGAYPVQNDPETTVLKALALAEGLTPNAGERAYVFRRESGGASKNEMPVELKQIMARKAPDKVLVASDILYVPDNHSRRVALAVMERILMFGTTAGATALVLH